MKNEKKLKNSPGLISFETCFRFEKKSRNLCVYYDV